MKKKQVQWKSFNINMPDELKPIYDFLQSELNFILSNDETRAILDKIDLSKLRGDVWRDLRDNLKFRINEWPLHKLKFYPTRSRIANIKRSNSIPELARNAVFNLDYTISSKQFFRMKQGNICEIKIGKKDWIEYEIVFPSSIDERFTGKIAKPRFIKRKRDNQYIGVCAYQYEIGDYELEDKII